MQWSLYICIAIIRISKMTIKFLTLITLFILCFSCKKTHEGNANAVAEQNKEQAIFKNDISNLDYIAYTLDDKTELIIENWQEYSELNDVITNVKSGDLSFFNDNNKSIKTLFKNLETKIPEEIKTPSITARMLVLETKFYTLESLSNLSTTGKEELNDIIKEFLESFSYLNLQINKKIENDSQNTEKP